jgi:predicted DCC family thiol-disulfide oxidoreductase YuxK
VLVRGYRSEDEEKMLAEGEVRRTVPAGRQAILVYDGECSFCSRWVRRIKSWDRAGAVRYVPLQDARATSLTGRSRNELRRSVHMVRPDGAVFAGAAAIRELLSHLPCGAVVGVLLKLPGTMLLAELLYRGIARRFGPVGSGPGCS